MWGKGADPKQQPDHTGVKSNFKRSSQDNTLLVAAASPADQRPMEGGENSAMVALPKPTGVPPIAPVYVSPRKGNKRLKNSQPELGEGTNTGGTENTVVVGERSMQFQNNSYDHARSI